MKIIKHFSGALLKWRCGTTEQLPATCFRQSIFVIWRFPEQTSLDKNRYDRIKFHGQDMRYVDHPKIPTSMN